jgi:hypothetical protein
MRLFRAVRSRHSEGNDTGLQSVLTTVTTLAWVLLAIILAIIVLSIVSSIPNVLIQQSFPTPMDYINDLYNKLASLNNSLTTLNTNLNTLGFKLGTLNLSYIDFKSYADPLLNWVKTVNTTETATYIVFTDGSRYYAKNGDTGIVEYSDTDATKVIQYAIDKANALGGGIVHLRPGRYKLSTSIVMRSGVVLQGEGWNRQNIEPSPPETGNTIGGTVLDASGIDAITGANITAGGIRDIAIDYPARGIVFGGTNTLGCAYFHIRNVRIYKPSVRGVEVTNFQYLRIDQLYIIDIPSGSDKVAPGAWFKNDHRNWAGGNSVFTDIFIRGGAQADGVMRFEAINNSLNLIEVHRPQINMWGSNGVGSGIRLINRANYLSSLSRISIYGIDVEGNPEAALRLEGVIESFFEFTYTDATYSAHLKASPTGISTYMNIFVGRVRKIKNESMWQNWVISSDPSFSMASGGIYGLVMMKNPASGNDMRPAIYIGSSVLYLDEKYSIRHPGRNFGVATISAGNTRVTVSHGLSSKPTTVIVTPLAQPPGKIWVENIGSTSFDIVTDTAPTTSLQVAWYAEV